jgi:hypothetical protein
LHCTTEYTAVAAESIATVTGNIDELLVLFNARIAILHANKEEVAVPR